MNKEEKFQSICLEIKQLGFKHYYKNCLSDLKKFTHGFNPPVTDPIKTDEDRVELLNDLLINFNRLQDVHFAATFDKQVEFDNKIEFLLSFNPSLFTRETDYAMFDILINDSISIHLLLGNIDTVKHLLLTYPSCMETVSMLNDFRNKCKDTINQADSLIRPIYEQNLEFILKADYKALKEDLENIIENSCPLYIEPIDAKFYDIKGTSLKNIEKLECQLGKEMRLWYEEITNDTHWRVLNAYDEIALDYCFKLFLERLETVSYYCTPERIKSFKDWKDFRDEIKLYVDAHVKKYAFHREFLEGKTDDTKDYSFQIWLDDHFTQIFVEFQANKRIDYTRTPYNKGDFNTEIFRLTGNELYKAMHHYYTKGFRLKPIKVAKEEIVFTQPSLF